MEDALTELLGDETTTIRDHDDCGVMHYYALGGQLKCLQRFLIENHPKFSQPKQDPEYLLAKQAAMGGHKIILILLRNQFHYDLKQIFHSNGKKGLQAMSQMPPVGLLVFPKQNQLASLPHAL